MKSAFSYIARSLVLAIFSGSIIAIFCRFICVLLIIFFILPIFYSSLRPLLIRTQLFLLSIIVCEFFAAKISNLMQGTNDLEVKKPRSKSSGSLDGILSNRKLSLFLHTERVTIEKLIPKSMYKELVSEDSDSVKFFDHYDQPIVSIGVEACRRALKSFIIYPDFARVLKAIKKSYAKTVTFVIAAEDLCLIFSQKEPLLQLQACASELGVFLSKKVHINLIIENMNTVTGFHSFCNFALQQDPDLMNIKVSINSRNEKDVLSLFEKKFLHFNDKIDAAIRRTNFTHALDAQNCLTFSQQLQYLRVPMIEVLLALLLTSKEGGSFFNNIMVDMYFFSSTQDFLHKSDVLPKELQLCLAGKDDVLKCAN